MRSTLLYLSAVLIWGSTWLAIEYQLGTVAIEVSLIYRFGLAAVIMWIYCWLKGLPMGFSLRNHGFILLLALFNFSFNYLILYWAQAYLTSAMASILFSMLLLVNIINTRIFFGKPIDKRVYLGALTGILGVITLFWPDLMASRLDDNMVTGVVLVILGTLVASCGNMISVRNSNHGMNILSANAWGMLYGTGALLIYALLLGSEFNLEFSASYLLSLGFLAVFGTVIAFACYFVLLKDIGPEKASYIIIFFPFVAVILSTFFERFIWSEYTVAGFSLVILGNVILLTPLEKLLSAVRFYSGELRDNSCNKLSPDLSIKNSQ